VLSAVRKFIIRRMLQRMAQRYDCDVSYLLYLLAQSPKAFWTFMRATAMSRHCQRAPVEAAYTVRLLASVSEDCGSCAQLQVQHAAEAKMATDQIEAVLTHNTAAMNPAVALAFRYADAVLNRRPDAGDARDAVRAAWGHQGLIDLAMSMQGARLYPMMKEALGYAVECRRLRIDDRWLDVARQATG
jgi:hypothetical protein